MSNQSNQSSMFPELKMSKKGRSPGTKALAKSIASPQSLSVEDRISRDLAEMKSLFLIKNGKAKDTAWGRARTRSIAHLADLRKESGAPIPRAGSTSDDDPWTRQYDTYGLIQPRYNFFDLFDIVEECDTLRSCIDSVSQGLHGNGYGFQFAGDDKQERDLDVNKAAHTELLNFCDNVNEDGGLTPVLKLNTNDLFSTGNGPLEIVRNLDKSRNPLGDIESIYHLPVTYCRMTPEEDEPIECKVPLVRKGEVITVKRWKRFRKYARLFPSGRIQWFKEFGDPRTMDRITGEYDPPDGSRNTKNPATEVIWRKLPFRNSDYGVPPWVTGSCLTTIKGRVLASWCNMDLFHNQGVPPLLIVVEDGQLTGASIDEIENTIESWHNVERMNRTCVLHVEPNLVSFDGQRTKSAVQVIPLRDAKAEDFLFAEYLAYSEKVIRKAFKLPPLIQGSSEDYSLASAQASQIVVEQQVFGPLRREFDEMFNLKIIHGSFGHSQWRFISKGPKITGSEELTKMIRMFAISGGASSNQIIELANETLGTDWSISDAPASKIPVMELQALARLNRLEYDEKGERTILPASSVGGASSGDETGADDNPDETGDNPTKPDDNGNKPGKPDSSGQDPNKPGKSVSKSAATHYTWLLSAMEEIEDDVAEYEPTDISPDDIERWEGVQKSTKRAAA